MGQNLDTVNITPVELKAEDLKNDSGEYGLSSLPWGSDSSAAPEALGIRFYEIPTLWNETLAAYPSRDSSSILGYAARVIPRGRWTLPAYLLLKHHRQRNNVQRSAHPAPVPIR